MLNGRGFLVSNSTTYALILAGGTGARFSALQAANYPLSDTGTILPKQFSLIDGKTVLERSIMAFENNPSVDKILVVMNKDYLVYAKRIIDKTDFKKIAGIIPGGNTRFESSLCGLTSIREHLLSNSNCNLEDNEKFANVKVLIHDAARAFVTEKIIDNVIQGLSEADGVQPIVPINETLVTKVQGKWLTVNRDDYAAVQTPQGFHYLPIYNAYQRAVSTPETSWVPTDDISVLQEYGHNAKIISVSGDYHNKKVTYPEDLK